MRRLIPAIFLALAACLLQPVLTGCGKEGADSDGKVYIPLALSISSVPESVGTKMADGIVQRDGQEETYFRGIKPLYILPFYSIAPGAEVQPSNVRNGEISLPQNEIPAQFVDDANRGSKRGLVSGINAHLYASVGVPPHSNSVLVYGQAIDDGVLGSTAKEAVIFRHHNGEIVPTNLTLDGSTAGELSFNLRPCLDSNEQQTAFTDWLSGNVALLNAIANTFVSTTSGNYAFMNASGELKNVWAEFSGEGRVFSCADAVLGGEHGLLTKLYRACADIASLSGNDDQKLAYNVCAYMNGATERLTISGSGTSAIVTMNTSAPYTDFGLPDGTATVRWFTQQGTPRFIVPGEADGVNIGSADKYCYPPALWYYVNSPMLAYKRNATSTNPVVLYNKNTAWDTIKDAYPLPGVEKDSDAALIRDPLHYAVALLKMKLTRIGGVSATSYPLTGIIFGGQRTQQYNFTPDKTAEERFIYDSEVSDTGDFFYSLAFESVDDPNVNRNVNFALEFRNDSGAYLYGVRECIIRPGAKFYLIGTLVYDNGTQPGGETMKSVFVKDHITSVDVTFPSAALAYCYELLPALNSPDLKVAVNAKFNWDAATPKNYQIRE